MAPPPLHESETVAGWSDEPHTPAPTAAAAGGPALQQQEDDDNFQTNQMFKELAEETNKLIQQTHKSMLDMAAQCFQTIQLSAQSTLTTSISYTDAKTGELQLQIHESMQQHYNTAKKVTKIETMLADIDSIIKTLDAKDWANSGDKMDYDDVKIESGAGPHTPKTDADNLVDEMEMDENVMLKSNDDPAPKTDEANVQGEINNDVKIKGRGWGAVFVVAALGGGILWIAKDDLINHPVSVEAKSFVVNAFFSAIDTMKDQDLSFLWNGLA